MRLFYSLLCLATLVRATIFPATVLSSTTDSAPSRILLVVGDSLSAEYGLKRGTGWVPLLAQRLGAEYPNYKVVNASISGDTTSGGVSRLPALLQLHQPEIVVLELGANDALRGLSLDLTEQNLRAMTQTALEARARVVLVGMQIPPNYGRAYSERFAQVFSKVAQSEKTGFVPFLMEGIAANKELFQADGIHPNETAQAHLLINVWPVLQPMLQ